MKSKLFKKLMVSVLACSMVFTNIPVTALAQDVYSETTTDTQEEFQVTFSNTYAKVGEPLTLEITGADDCTYQWKNNKGNSLGTTNSYTPTEADLETFISVTVTSNGESRTTSIYCSKLPVVYINTENNAPIVSKDEYLNATMKIQGNETYSDSSVLYDGDIEISGRGNSTWGMPKKPYKIKLDKKADLFGMDKHKRWVLLANYSDASLMRNTLAYNLSGAMGMPQMETIWVDVVLNGEYVGNYQFCEQIKIDKENRVDIFDWESLAEDAAEIIAEAESFSDDDAGDLEDLMKEEDMSWITSGEVMFNDTMYKISDYEDIEVPDITGGYLMELDEYYDEVSKFKTYSNQPIMFKSPEFVSTNEDMMNYIQTYIQSFEDAVQSADYTAPYKDTTKHYSDLFDFNALVDYWLISEIFFNEELNKKSTYMYKDIDEPVYMGPIWDMDYSSGGEGLTEFTDKWSTTFFQTNAQANMWYKDLIQDPYFVLKAQERYWEIRNTLVQDMLNSIDTSYTLLKESADANADVWYGKHNFDTEVDNLKEWFHAHLEWLDLQMASEDSLLSSLDYENDYLTISAADASGNALHKDTVSGHAAADAIVDLEEPIVLTVSSDASTDKNADVFINSKKIGSVQLGSSITITNDQLTSDYGKKNIIEVKLSDGGITTQNCMTILEMDTSNLPPEIPVIDPEFDGKDYPTTSMIAIADSQYKEFGNEGPARFVLDGDENTHWHTNWATQEAYEEENRWVGVELAEAIMVDGIRCLPRQDKTANGLVTSYKVQYRMTADEEWQTAATGTWDENNRDWKLVTFEPVEAKYVRIVGVHTYSTEGPDKHMSMTEFRVLDASIDETVKRVTRISIAQAANKVTYKTGETFDPTGLEIIVSYSDGTSEGLSYDVEGITLTPTAGTVLTEADKFITITYAGKTTTMPITVNQDGTDSPTINNNIPVIYINTENNAPIVSKDDYVNATMKIQGNDTYSDASVLYDGDIEISGRGNSTWPMPKKPYKIKLDKKADLFGMGKHKRWVLLANYTDESLMRNTLAYRLSGDLGMPNMETIWVDVVLNGEYQGNYQFCEQIKLDEDNRVDVFDWESLAEDAAEIIAEKENLSDDAAGDLEDFMKEEDMSWITSGEVIFNDNMYKISDYPDIEIPSINGGYLLELDEYFDEVSKFKTDNGQPIMFKNPEFVYTNEDMLNFVQNYVQGFENAVQSTDYTAAYEGKSTHYTELFDFDSLVDYWLISEIFFNEEFNKKSTYMYKEIDELMKMGPIWDMDYSSGGEGFTYITNQWATIYFSTNAQANMWYKSLIQDPYFILKAQERYWEIRNTYVKDMVDSIDTNYELLKDSAADNTATWADSSWGDRPRYKESFATHANNLKFWFEEHLEWMDTQMTSEASILASLGYETKGFDADELKLSITDSNGNALPKDNLSTKAKASALIEDGQSLRLKVDGGNLTGSADVYVNSKKIGTVAIGSEITITGEQLSATLGEKDIIEVKISETLAGKDRYDLVQNCITVLEKPCAHQFGEWETIKPATCTEAGTESRICKLCDTKETSTIDALGHSFAKDYTVDKEVTCTEAGSKSKHCTRANCDAKTDVTEIATTGHNYGSWKITKAATCTEEGELTKTCSACGKTETSAMEALGHTFGTEWSKDANNHWHVCTTNGCTATIDKAAHIWNNGVITKESTTTQPGEKTFTCTICGQTKVVVIPILAANKNELATTITTAESLKAADYTTASYAAVQTILTLAKAVNAKADATQAEVDAAKTALDSAIKALVKATKPSTPQPEEKPLTKGTKFTQNGITYKVTKSDTRKGEVSYVNTTNKLKTITIPKTVKNGKFTYKVTAIENNAFKKNTKVTKIVISSNVTTIGASAFEGCTKLTNVIIGKNVTKIGDKAFKGCKSLKKVTIPAKVTIIGKEAFQSCGKLANITISTAKLKTVAKNAFKGIKSNAKIKVPSKKFTAYKKLLKGKGQGKKVRITK